MLTLWVFDIEGHRVVEVENSDTPPPYVAVYLQCVPVLQCVAVLVMWRVDMEGLRVVEVENSDPPPRQCLCESHFELFDKERNRILELCI